MDPPANAVLVSACLSIPNQDYNKIKCVNLSVSCLGIFSNS